MTWSRRPWISSGCQTQTMRNPRGSKCPSFALFFRSKKSCRDGSVQQTRPPAIHRLVDCSQAKDAAVGHQLPSREEKASITETKDTVSLFLSSSLTHIMSHERTHTSYPSVVSFFPLTPPSVNPSRQNLMEDLSLPATRTTHKHETLHDGPAISDSDKATLSMAKSAGNRIRLEQRPSPIGAMDGFTPKSGMAGMPSAGSFQGWKNQSVAKKEPVGAKPAISEEDILADEEKFAAAQARRKALRRRSTVLALEETEASQQKAAANEEKIATITLGGRRASLAMAEIKASAVSARRGSVVSKEDSSGGSDTAGYEVTCRKSSLVVQIADFHGGSHNLVHGLGPGPYKLCSPRPGPTRGCKRGQY